jgi:iron-sulfur cluster assembly protein
MRTIRVYSRYRPSIIDSMLQLSDDAVTAILELAGEGGLRFSGHESDGEVELEIEPADGPQDGDETVERGGARVFLDAVAVEALDDQVLDVEPHGDHVHFVFAEQD